MNIAHFSLGVDFGYASVYCTPYRQRSVGIGGITDHAVVVLDGQLYSAYTGNKITEYEASYYYTFIQIYPNK